MTRRGEGEGAQGPWRTPRTRARSIRSARGRYPDVRLGLADPPVPVCRRADPHRRTPGREKPRGPPELGLGASVRSGAGTQRSVSASLTPLARCAAGRTPAGGPPAEKHQKIADTQACKTLKRLQLNRRLGLALDQGTHLTGSPPRTLSTHRGGPRTPRPGPRALKPRF